MNSYDAVVYDLDGTLVHLAVDWDAVASEVAATLRDRGTEPPDDLWAMLQHARDAGHGEAVESVIADHERDGARRSTRLARADDLPLDVPVGVCSLNCAAAVRIALDTHGLADHVRTVVGRDTLDTEKPDPKPLLTALGALDATPERTLFVGDSTRDEETARRAGTAFEWVED
ncbi:HAD hydrolase-like protein [Halomarina oriensis]|uniref:HAD hydrolase-like protein n=1 Tax=Halomarina oriensis TaxID=671145 RepID=A0A6B0GR35_9EURY|nr:HAD hydrolase-like protein [Halomarina oriensis]